MNPTGSFTSLADWLEWLESLSPTEIVLGLERVLDVLGRLKPELPQRVIHVAGTNGKGSSALMLEALLMASGAVVGAYTSPHLFNYNERIRVNGEAASDAEITAALAAVESVRNGVPLTYFEYGTLAALQVFAARDCDALVLEVGMGGRLDAVNAVEPEAGLITNVSLDHCEWLGDDVETIANEKAGIMRPGRPMVYGSTDRPRAIDRCAAATAAQLICAGREFTWQIEEDSEWTWRGQSRHLAGLDQPSLPGRFQIGNAAAVLALAEAIGLESVLHTAAINLAFSSLVLPGRLQHIRTNRHWILDVAHNPSAAEALRSSLANGAVTTSLTAVIAALDDKNVEGMVEPLLSRVGRWIAVTADAPRAIAAATLASRIAAVSGKPCLIADSIPSALQYAVTSTAEDDSILVTGSFYVVGPGLRWIQDAVQASR